VAGADGEDFVNRGRAEVADSAGTRVPLPERYMAATPFGEQAPRGARTQRRASGDPCKSGWLIKPSKGARLDKSWMCDLGYRF